MQGLSIRNVNFQGRQPLSSEELKKLIENMTYKSKIEPKPDLKIATMIQTILEKLKSKGINLDTNTVYIHNSDRDTIELVKKNADNELRIEITLYQPDISKDAINIGARLTDKGEIINPRSRSFPIDIYSDHGPYYDVIPEEDCIKRIHKEIEYTYKNFDNMDLFSYESGFTKLQPKPEIDTDNYSNPPRKSLGQYLKNLFKNLTGKK